MNEVHTASMGSEPARARFQPHGQLVQQLMLAASGGLMTEQAFPDRSWWPLALLGVTFLVLALSPAPSGRAWLLGFTWGLAFFLPHLWWADYAVGPLPWLALAALEAGLVGVACWSWSWVRRSSLLVHRWWAQVIAFAMTWVVGEQLRQVWPFGGFPWGRLAFSQADGPLLGLASVGGAPLISAAVAAGGFLVALGLQGIRTSPRAAALPGLLAAAIVAAGWFVPLPTLAQTGSLRLGAVQGNVSTPGLAAFDRAREVLDNHALGTRALLREVAPGELDLVLWPENASDVNPRADLEAAQVVDDAAVAIGAPILLGTDRYEQTGRYNDMVLWEAGLGVRFSYSKQIPAAFGEYIPLRGFVRLFSPEVDRVRTDMVPGTEVGVVPVEVQRLGRIVDVATLICFEVAYDAVTREAILAGGEMLVIPTNNASFGYTAESTQQLAMSRLRAVEHGRATVQISTVGVSAVIAPDGTVLQATDLFIADQMVAELPLRTSLTLADRAGDWPIAVTTILVVGALSLGLWKGWSERSRWRPRRALRDMSRH